MTALLKALHAYKRNLKHPSELAEQACHIEIDLAGVGGIELPLEVSAIDSFANATDGSERRLSIVARHPVSLARVLSGEELLCDIFDRALAVSQYLLESAPAWMSQE